MNKKMTELQLENDKIMSKLMKYPDNKDKVKFYDLLNSLVWNELAQEKMREDEND